MFIGFGLILGDLGKGLRMEGLCFGLDIVRIWSDSLGILNLT